MLNLIHRQNISSTIEFISAASIIYLKIGFIFVFFANIKLLIHSKALLFARK